MAGELEGLEAVLVVDDNPADIRFIEEAFDASELEPTVHSTTTKGEALAVLAQRDEYADAPEVDATFLDWHLSKTTGEEVLDAAKAVDPPVPVVVMTGSKSERDHLESSLPEADRCIEKRTDPEAYVEIIRDLLAAE